MLTDKQLRWVFENRLSSHNGFKCCRVNYENGVNRTVCNGESFIVGGKVKVVLGCGEPCSFICDDTQALSRSVEQIVEYDRIIEEAKKSAP